MNNPIIRIDGKMIISHSPHFGYSFTEDIDKATRFRNIKEAEKFIEIFDLKDFELIDSVEEKFKIANKFKLEGKDFIQTREVIVSISCKDFYCSECYFRDKHVCTLYDEDLKFNAELQVLERCKLCLDSEENYYSGYGDLDE